MLDRGCTTPMHLGPSEAAEVDNPLYTGCVEGVEKGKDGDDLLSHSVPAAVPSACQGLTSVFGMGTGGSPELSSPSKRGAKVYRRKRRVKRRAISVRVKPNGSLVRVR